MAKIKATPIVPSPADFISQLTIENPQGEGPVGYIPFALWPAQADVLRTFEIDPLVIVLKARQLGISWLACAYALWLCIYHPVKSTLIFSKGELEAAELLRRISGMVHRLPDRLKATLPTLQIDNTQDLGWSNGSRIKSLPATRTAGSSFTASLVIADEFAKMQWADDLYTSMKPTIDGGGKLIIISTAQGNGNLFYKLWQRAEKHESAFTPVFLSWTARPDRTAKWYAQVSREAVSQALLDQEYPAKAEDAFNASSVDKFITDMLLWDQCREALPALTLREPMVLAMDAGISNDSFAIVGVTRHPARRDDVAVRYVREWKPPKRGTLDFGAEDGPEQTVRRLCARGSGVNVVHLTYDPYALHDMATRLQRDGVVLTSAFNQGADRLTADKQLLDLIMQRRIAHDGNESLRAHVDHADKKPDVESRKLRIVKREDSLKIDLTVACSMAAYRCLKLPL